MPDNLTLTTPLDTFLSKATLAEALAYLGETRAAHFVWCGPATGADATPAFRLLVAEDIPALNYSTFDGQYSSLSGKPTLGTMAAQNADAVAITGGTITGITGAFSMASGHFIFDGTNFTFTPPGSVVNIGAAAINASDGSIGTPSATYNLGSTGVKLTSTATVSWSDGGNIYATPDTFLRRAGTGALALRTGTADQTLILGAASGPGGGVLTIHQIVTPPTPTAEDVHISFDGTNCVIDKPADLSVGPPKLPASAGSTENPTTDAPVGWVRINRDGTVFVIPCYTELP